MQSGGVTINSFNTGYCRGPAKVAMKRLSWNRVNFIAQAFTIDVPNVGRILFDTGYDKAYYHALNHWSERLYDYLLPVVVEECDFGEIDYIFISHFHVDHICGLKRLGDIPWIYRSDILERLMQMSKRESMRHGFFKHLIPDVPKGSIEILEKDFTQALKETSLRSCPMFGGEIVDLPGHALGQMGLLFDPIFFVADAIWLSEAYQQNCLPNAIGLHLQHDRQAYIETFERIQKLPFTPIPSHRLQ